MDEFVATTITFFALLMLLFLPVIVADEVTVSEPVYEVESVDEICVEAVKLPYIGLKGFLYCPENKKTWSGRDWIEPGSFQERRIQEYYAGE